MVSEICGISTTFLLHFAHLTRGFAFVQPFSIFIVFKSEMQPGGAFSGAAPAGFFDSTDRGSLSKFQLLCACLGSEAETKGWPRETDKGQSFTRPRENILQDRSLDFMNRYRIIEMKIDFLNPALF